MNPFHETRSYGSGLALQAFPARDLSFLAHWHNDIELLFVSSGSIIVGIDKEERRLRPGDLAVCASRDIHYYERSGSRSETFLVILKPEVLGRAPQWPQTGRLAAHFASRGTELARAASELVPRIAGEMREKNVAYEGVARGAAMELCALAERELKLVEARGRGEGERMQAAIDYLYENAAYPIGLEDAARAAALSPSYFSRAFSAAVGTSFRSYLNGIRLERAQRLIEESDGRIADIALECGFESVRSFNRAFKSSRGVAPSELRRAPSELRRAPSELRRVGFGAGLKAERENRDTEIAER
jgi:AraC-type DNA-binding domain-containing proteins